MIETIRKRDGRVVEFDSTKITTAIEKAGKITGEFTDREARKLTLRVLTLLHDLRLGPAPEVEQVQDIVERVLLDSPYYKTAKSYILYREQHSQIRTMTTAVNLDLVDNYIQKLDWKIKENSNMCYSLQGLEQLHLLRHHRRVLAEPDLPPGDSKRPQKRGHPYPRPESAFRLLRGMGPEGPFKAGVQGGFGKGGVRPPQASPLGPGADRQFLLYPPGGSRRGPGPLQLRHPARPLHPV